MNGRNPATFPLLPLLGCLALAACASPPHEQTIALPAASSLETAAALLEPNVEVMHEPPRWATRARFGAPSEGDGVAQRAYGIGVASEGAGYGEGLAGAMRDARQSVIDWLVESGVRVASPRDLLDALKLPREHIVFEALAYVPRESRWYALARFDLAAAAAQTQARVARLDRRIADLRLPLVDSQKHRNERADAALTSLLLLERREQWMQQLTVYRAAAQSELPPAEIEAIRARARHVLADHGVRIRVDSSNELAGMRETVAGAIGALHLHDSELGEGLVEVRIEERGGESRGGELWVLEGEVYTLVAGTAGLARTTPVRSIGLGDDTVEARERAVALLRSEVREIVEADLRRGRLAW